MGADGEFEAETDTYPASLHQTAAARRPLYPSLGEIGERGTALYENVTFGCIEDEQVINRVPRVDADDAARLERFDSHAVGTASLEDEVVERRNASRSAARARRWSPVT